MELGKKVVGNEAHIEVARISDSELNPYVFGHLEHLREILDSIPAQYRGDARIGFYGESELRVTYMRPATPAELEEELAASGRSLETHKQSLEWNISRLLATAATLGVDPSKLGLSETDAGYVITKTT